jgi:plasmid stabilization system protein ParE
MAYKIVRRKRFVNKLYKLLLYLEANWGIKVAIEFQEKVDTHLKALEQQPYLGRASEKTIARSILITDHNRIVYKVTSDKIIVLTMFDTRMNPKKNKYR